LREAFQRHDARAGGFDCVVTLRERFDRGQLAAIGAEVSELLDRLAKGE
jgi:RNase P protein component